jgi:hypothetical protein
MGMVVGFYCLSDMIATPFLERKEATLLAILWHILYRFEDTAVPKGPNFLLSAICTVLEEIAGVTIQGLATTIQYESCEITHCCIAPNAHST